MKKILFFIFLALFLIFLPKFFVFIYLLVKYSVAKIVNSYMEKIIDFLIFFYSAIILSYMLANREYYKGEEVGFGDDMYHYYNAFDWIKNVSFSEFLSNFNIVTSLTGSGEVGFWVIVKIMSYFINDNFYIHIFLTFLGLCLIYISGEIWKRCGLLFFFFYTNTITFFAYQGSAIRAGLAIGFIFIGLAIFLKYKKNIYLFISPLIHFSSIPLIFIIILGRFKEISLVNKIKYFIVFFLTLAILIYISIQTQDAGLGFKLSAKLASENETTISAILQFFIEVFFVISIVYFFFKEKVDSNLLRICVYFFICSILVLLVSESAFSRFYRYEYIIFIFIFSSIFMNIKGFLYRYMVIISSFLWFIFIGYTRYSGVFAEDFLGFVGYSILDIL